MEKNEKATIGSTGASMTIQLSYVGGSVEIHYDWIHDVLLGAGAFSLVKAVPKERKCLKAVVWGNSRYLRK